MRAFRLAYDGRPFRGFQRQPDPEVPTVEDALLAACRRLDVAFDGERDTPHGYAAAGRTDAGVSALAQTVAFAAPDYCDPATLNAELPDAVRAWAAADVADGFHATHDAVRRAYVYHLHAPAAAVDDGRARAACDRLSGEHDFHNLTPDETGTVRDLSVALERAGPYLRLRFAAGGFPRHFVRRAVSLVDAVARGDRALEAVERALGPDPLPGPEGVRAAPAPPLVLTGVTYPGVAFAADPEGGAEAVDAFESRRVEATTAARVARTVRDGVRDGE